MAAPLVHQVNVKATPDQIYEAVSTVKGLAAFWTSQSQAEPTVGSIATFGFGGPSQRMRVDELKPGKRALGRLIQIALDVAGSLDPREVIARILERGTHAVQADRATLSSLVDDHVVIEATYGRAGELTWVGQRYSLDYFAEQPLVQKAIDTLQPAVGGRLAADRAAPEFREALANVRHVAVVPLVHGTRAVGMLVFSRYEDRPFTAADLAALTLLGTISGLR